MQLTEDEIYRSSSQFKLWNFTPEALASLRTNTNKAAAERVRAAFKRRRDGRLAADKAQNGEIAAENGADNQVKEVECLTLEEEQRLLGYYCGQCLKLGKDTFKYPPNVYATAIQYMKRFYLFNSPMTYHPKDILKTALFLATKTENHHQDLDKYCQSIPGKKATLREDVLAPEFILTQALRFTFEVKHPFRGLTAGFLELLATVKGETPTVPGAEKTIGQLQTEILTLAREANGPPQAHERSQMEKRIATAQNVASDRYLKNAALLSDAYFLYTPAQIWLAALYLADEPLALFYLKSKFPATPVSDRIAVVKAKVIAAIKACAQVLATGEVPSQPTADEVAELKRVDKKLYQCRNPDKIDLVGLNKAQKRDAMSDGKLGESVAKKRKIEREREEKEADEFWGPPIQKS